MPRKLESSEGIEWSVRCLKLDHLENNKMGLNLILDLETTGDPRDHRRQRSERPRETEIRETTGDRDLRDHGRQRSERPRETEIRETTGDRDLRDHGRQRSERPRETEIWETTGDRDPRDNGRQRSERPRETEIWDKKLYNDYVFYLLCKLQRARWRSQNNTLLVTGQS